MKGLTSSRVIFGIFIVSSVTFIILGYNHILHAWPSFAGFFLGWVTAFLKMLYDCSDRFYLLVNRLRARLLNIATTWELTAEYAVNEFGVLDEVANSVKEAFPNLQVWQNEPSRKVIKTDKLTFRLRESADVDADLIGCGGSKCVVINTGGMTIPYRQIEDTLERQLVPLLVEVERTLGSGRGKYTLRINYNGSNPFFGLYVKRLPMGSVVNFRCEIVEPFADEPARVTIEAKRAIIIASSPSNMSSASRKYLLLSSTSSR
jgi:hypothetical protein